MRHVLLKVSILGTAAAMAVLVFSLYVLVGAKRSSALYSLKESSEEKVEQPSAGERMRQLEQRVRELSRALRESEQHLAEWEEASRSGEIPEYLRAKRSVGAQLSTYKKGEQEKGEQPSAGRQQADGRQQTAGTGNLAAHLAARSAPSAASGDKESGKAEGEESRREEPQHVGGLLGLYYQGRRFEELKLLMTDYEVDFDFTDQSPDRIITEDNFSIRWVGYIKIDRESGYTFHTLSDDGVRLWVDGHPVIDNWGDHAATLNTGKMHLKEGYHSLRLDFYEHGGVAAIKLYWSSGLFPMEVIPPANLYHDPELEKKLMKELR